MNGRFLIFLCFFLVASFGAFGQLSEPQRWKIKQRGLTKINVSFQDYYASEAKIGWMKGKGSQGPNVEKSSSKQDISLNWNTPSGTRYNVEGKDRRRLHIDNRLKVISEPVEWISKKIDTTKNFHHFDVSVSTNKETVATMHVSVQPYWDAFAPPPVWGIVELSSGRILKLERDLLPLGNFWQIMNPPSVWKFYEAGNLLAGYNYHYKRPKFSYSPNLAEGEIEELTAAVSVMSVWIKLVYMIPDEM